ncbi:MAG: MFS transporter, partial [Alphaproteobacteria bacterium]
TMSIVLLDAAEPAMRSRIMGVRMLAVYGLPIGLVSAGWLVENLGYTNMVTLYSAVGILASLTIALIWRKDLLRQE